MTAKPEWGIEIDRGMLRALVSAAHSDSHRENIFCVGVEWDEQGGNYILTATEGHMLVQTRLPHTVTTVGKPDGFPGPFILPVNYLPKSGTGKGNIKIELDVDHIRITDLDGSMRTIALEEAQKVKYVDWKSVMPEREQRGTQRGKLPTVMEWGMSNDLLTLLAKVGKLAGVKAWQICFGDFGEAVLIFDKYPVDNKYRGDVRALLMPYEDKEEVKKYQNKKLRERRQRPSA